MKTAILSLTIYALGQNTIKIVIPSFKFGVLGAHVLKTEILSQKCNVLEKLKYWSYQSVFFQVMQSRCRAAYVFVINCIFQI